MSTQIDEGGPAFPVPDSHHANGQVQYGANGMTLRDWFAGQALAQLIKREVRQIRKERPKMDCFGSEDSQEVPYHTSFVASESYAIADAMIAARKVQP